MSSNLLLVGNFEKYLIHFLFGFALLASLLFFSKFSLPQWLQPILISHLLVNTRCTFSRAVVCFCKGFSHKIIFLNLSPLKRIKLIKSSLYSNLKFWKIPKMDIPYWYLKFKNPISVVSYFSIDGIK